LLTAESCGKSMLEIKVIGIGGIGCALLP